MEDVFSLAAFVGGITQAIKMTGKVESKFLPLVAIAIGAVLNPFIAGNFQPITFIYGAMIGLTTTGLVNLADTKIEKYTAGQDIVSIESDPNQL